jgi:hypothetical protein
MRPRGCDPGSRPGGCGWAPPNPGAWPRGFASGACSRPDARNIHPQRGLAGGGPAALTVAGEGGAL